MVDRRALRAYEPRIGRGEMLRLVGRDGGPYYLNLQRREVIEGRLPMRRDEAEELWEMFLASHGGSPKAALGEVIRLLLDAGLIRHDDRR